MSEAILRKAIEDYLAGDYDNPRRHRPGDCRHGRPYYEECEACNTEHFTRALAAADAPAGPA